MLNLGCVVLQMPLISMDLTGLRSKATLYLM